MVSESNAEEMEWFKDTNWFNLYFNSSGTEKITPEEKLVIRKLRFLYKKSLQMSVDEEQTRLSKLIDDPHLKKTYRDMEQLVKNKNQLKSMINFKSNRGKILKEYENLILKSVRLVSPEEFKNNFENCVRFVRRRIGNAPYGLLLGKVPTLPLTTKGFIRRVDRGLIKSSVFLAHVVERIMGRKANAYISLNMSQNEMVSVAKQSKVKKWIWFDDGVFSGTQMRNSFIHYQTLPGEFFLIAPYATNKGFVVPPQVKKHITYIRAVKMNSSNNILRKSGIPKKKIMNLKSKTRYRSALNKTKSMFLMPHKIPDDFSFELFENIKNIYNRGPYKGPPYKEGYKFNANN